MSENQKNHWLSVAFVGVAGFEPTTSSSRTKHDATELCYMSFDISIARLKYLLIIADQFPDCAQKMEMGIGDMSIIRFYEKYKNEVPAVGRIMIWSKDKHLSCYQDNLSISRRREK